MLCYGGREREREAGKAPFFIATGPDWPCALISTGWDLNSWIPSESSVDQVLASPHRRRLISR